MKASNVFYSIDGIHQLYKTIRTKKYSTGFVLVDSNTKIHCLNLLYKKCPALKKLIVIGVDAGEKSKSLDTCQIIWNTLSQYSADRNSYLINLGGGMITDLGGFVASVYKRGISFYNLPTTLLGMVDASIGGKTGINFKLIKNQIGTIKDAEMVVILPDFLKTLNQRELISGYAEMLKSGLIKDTTYWQILKNGDPHDLSFLANQIKPSIDIKSEIVFSDKYETGLRKILNFGHTLGHAIESYFLSLDPHYHLLHGEAIAIGMILESYLSTKILDLNESDLNRITTTMNKIYKPIQISKNHQKKILDFLIHDKKTQNGVVKFVFLESIGNPKIDVVVDDFSIIEQAFDYYAKQSFG